MLDKVFELQRNHTNLKQEVIAGLTTFSTIAYIIFVNPTLLAKTGMNFESVLIATCLAAAIGTLLTGLLANYPFAQAPGMGLNAFFVYTVVFQEGYTWQGALAIVFISGIIFIILTLTGVRTAIVNGFPKTVLKAIPVGIGLFITLIGLNNAGVIDVNQGPIIDIILSQPILGQSELIDKVQSAPPQIIQLGNLGSTQVLLTLFGFILMAVLSVRKINGAILISILVVTIFSVILGQTQLPCKVLSSNLSLEPTFFKLDFNAIFRTESGLYSGILEFLTILISFTLVDLFDTLGTLYGTAEKGGFISKEGKLPKMKQAMLADAVATTFGSLVGTSTTTTYIESGSGIAAGGRTGLTSVVVAALFLLCILFAPLAAVIPTSATSPALIMVGVFMMGAVNNIKFQDLEVAVPSFVTIVLIPFTYSIATGIGAGIITYAIINLLTGKVKEVSPVTWIISGLFILKFMLA